MNTFIRSNEFDRWLSNLSDQKAKARILARLLSAMHGNFGDCETVGEGVSEMHIHIGAGYRVYYTRTGATVYFPVGRRHKVDSTKGYQARKKAGQDYQGE